MKAGLSLLSLVLLLGSCKPSLPPVPDDTLITLRRGPCFGDCPMYQVTIAADGLVTFESHDLSNVEVRGEMMIPRGFTGRISRDSVQQLISEFEEVDYFSLKDRYRTYEDGCPTVATDQSEVYTSLVMNGRSKSVIHNHGCWEEANGSHSLYKADLARVENRIDEIAGTKPWIERTRRRSFPE